MRSTKIKAVGGNKDLRHSGGMWIYCWTIYKVDIVIIIIFIIIIITIMASQAVFFFFY